MTNNRGNAWGALIKGGGYPVGPPRIPHWLCFPGNEIEFVRKLLCFSIEMKSGVRKGCGGWGLLYFCKRFKRFKRFKDCFDYTRLEKKKEIGRSLLLVGYCCVVLYFVVLC